MSTRAIKRRRVAAPAEKAARAYRQLWRIVEAVVVETFRAHPDYLTDKGRQHQNAVRSTTKRVVGAINGFAVEAAKRRSGRRPAPDKPTPVARLGPVLADFPGEQATVVDKTVGRSTTAIVGAPDGYELSGAGR